MKNKAAALVKEIIKAVVEMAKETKMEVRRKTKAFKTRLIIFALLQNRKTMLGSISHKLKGLMRHNTGIHHQPSKKLKRKEKEEEEEEELRQGQEGAVVVQKQNATVIPPATATLTYDIEEEDDEEEDQEKNPEDNNMIMYEEERKGELGGFSSSSVIEMVKSSKKDKGEEFRLEDEIDTVADLYIQRFHRQMRIQKQQLSPSTP